MGIFFDIVIALSMLAVLASLFMGFYSMMRGGEYGRMNSNKFMRYRVVTQAVAVVLISIGCWYKLTH
jgi:hypothetical protein